MSPAVRWRSTLAVVTTFLIVSVGYQIKLQKLAGSAAWPIWVIWLVSLVFAKTGTEFFWRTAVRIKNFRKFILGHTWIEGYWYLETIEYLPAKGTVQEKTTVQHGIIQFSYTQPDLVLQVYASNLIIGDNEESDVNPICVTLDAKLHYVNYFRRNVYNIQALGVAAGIFNSDNAKITDKYSGSIIYFEEGTTRRQHGYKIIDKQVKRLSKRLGRNWKLQILHDPVLLDEILGRQSSTSLHRGATASAK